MMRCIAVLLILLPLLASNVDAAREIEPNNHWLQGTLIDGKEPVEGVLNDEQDVYKLLLPETGEVTVTLDGFPSGSNLTLEILGFRKDQIVPINKVKTRGRQSLKVTFDAQETIGYLSITAAPAEKICKDQWCIMRLVANGPYYLLQSGSTLPNNWNGQPIVDPPTYQLNVVHPELVRERQKLEESSRAFADLPLFKENRFGLQFRYQSDWTVRAASEQRIVATPNHPSAAGVQVVVGIRDKVTFPGSSSTLQLNLAEKNLLDVNARIAKRGEMTLMQRPAPYLLGTYQLPGKESALAHLQLVLDYADEYYWISYSAPTERYQEYTRGFATILKTLDIEPPADQATEATSESAAPNPPVKPGS